MAAGGGAFPVPAPPLVVDLDGTLIGTDLLWETAKALVLRHPLSVPSLLQHWRREGRVGLKAFLARRVGVDPARLPYHPVLLPWLLAQKAQGRTLVLATGSHRLLAEAVAGHLGCFDLVLASEGKVNLKGARKREALVARYGEGGFDYVGNEAADLPVWGAARLAHVVSSSRSLISRVTALGNLGETF